MNDDRYYSIFTGDKMLRLPSVTTILGLLNKPALIIWAVKVTIDYISKHIKKVKKEMNDKEIFALFEEAKNEAKRIKEEAGELGSLAHRWIENHLSGVDISIPDEIKPAVEAFLQWKKEVKLEVIKLEHTVWSIKRNSYGYAGTLDLVAKITLNGKTKLYVIDFKTSKQFYPEMALQISAYRQAYNQQVKAKQKAVGNGILLLNKTTGIPQWIDCSNTYKKDTKAFQALVDFWWRWKEKKEE